MGFAVPTQAHQSAYCADDHVMSFSVLLSEVLRLHISRLPFVVVYFLWFESKGGVVMDTVFF